MSLKFRDVDGNGSVPAELCHERAITAIQVFLVVIILAGGNTAVDHSRAIGEYAVLKTWALAVEDCGASPIFDITMLGCLRNRGYFPPPGIQSTREPFRPLL
jgi:hypothetical protein